MSKDLQVFRDDLQERPPSDLVRIEPSVSPKDFEVTAAKANSLVNTRSSATRRSNFSAPIAAISFWTRKALKSSSEDQPILCRKISEVL